MVDVSLKKKAHDLVQKGKLDSALRVFSLLLEQDPEEASVHNSIGDILLKLKRNDEALDHFARSAEYYFLDGLHMVSLSVCRKALRIEPECGPALYIMARCFQAQEKTEQAKQHFVRFLRTKPDRSDPAVLETCYELTSLEPDDPRWVKRLAKLSFIQKKEGYLDWAVTLASERNMPEHGKMERMLSELRFSRRQEEEEAEAKTEAPSEDELSDYPPLEDEGEEDTGYPPLEEEEDTGYPPPEEEEEDTGYPPLEEAEEEEEEEEEELHETGRRVTAGAEAGGEDYGYPDEAEGPAGGYDDLMEDEQAADELDSGDYREVGPEPHTLDEVVEDPTQLLYVGQESEAGARPERSALEDLDFREEDFLDEIGEEIQGEEEDEAATGVSWKRQRLGEYFVASGMLKATDVLKGLERQAESAEGVRLGDVLVEMGLVSVRQVREALSKQVADMRSRLSDDPEDALGYVEMANLLLDVGDFYGSVNAYLKAADIYRALERNVMVFELLEGVLDICPESLTAAKELVRIRHTMGIEGQARALYRLAVAYLLNDSPHEAMAALEESIKTNPDFKMAKSLYAGIKPGYRETEEVASIAVILDDIDSMFDSDSAHALAEVIKEFRDGIEENVSPEDFNTHFDLGIAYREMGLMREALAEFELVLVSPDHRLKAREMLGRCCFDMQRYDEAEDHFLKGMSIAGDNVQALIGFHVNLSKVYDFTGRKKHAEAELEAAMTIDPILARIQVLE
jgi:tetratricopeptide (TPR) repeat protein